MPVKVNREEPVRVNREELLAKLQSVQPGLSQHEIIEQSSCLVFHDNEVMTFNDEVACRAAIKLPLEGAVQAKPLLDLLVKMSNDEINLKMTEEELIVKGGTESAGIRAEKEIMLAVDSIEKPEKWNPLHENFNDAIDIVSACAGRDESKFNTTCVHLHPKWIEACDNYQATRYHMETGMDEPILVRRESIKHASALGMTEFSVTTNWIHFRSASGLIMSCRRFSNDYPELTKVLAFEGEKATLPKDISEAIEKAEIFSANNTDNDQVLVILQAGKMWIEGTGAWGWYKKRWEMPSYTGKPIKFLIAPKLLSEISKRHNDCFISPNRLKVDGGHWTYITCLGQVSKHEKDNGDIRREGVER